MALVGGSLWVTTQAFAGAQHVGGTLRIAATGIPGREYGGTDSLDPPTVYIYDEDAAIRPVYDGLVAYRAAGGLDSLTLVPDLAVTLPVPSAGGLTYTFFLRPNIHYSDGRHGARRTTSGAASSGHWSSATRTAGRTGSIGIVGGKACHDHPASCDLPKASRPDDAARRVIFHLTAARP